MCNVYNNAMGGDMIIIQFLGRKWYSSHIIIAFAQPVQVRKNVSCLPSEEVPTKYMKMQNMSWYFIKISKSHLMTNLGANQYYIIQVPIYVCIFMLLCKEMYNQF